MKYKREFIITRKDLKNEKYNDLIHDITTGVIQDNKAEIIKMLVNSGYENPNEADMYFAIEPLVDKVLSESSTSLIVELSL